MGVVLVSGCREMFPFPLPGYSIGILEMSRAWHIYTFNLGACKNEELGGGRGARDAYGHLRLRRLLILD